MSRGRDLNRHHKIRMKKKRRDDVFYNTESALNKHVTTPKNCSCFMCGNPRKHLGNSKDSKTIQELRSELP